jgi:hypothetical protein
MLILQTSSDPSLNNRRDICSTILTAYWDQPAPSFFNGSEDTPEYDRRQNVSLDIRRNVDNS